TWMRLERPEDALARMRLVVARVPTWAKGHENLGALLLDSGQLEQAIAALEHGLDQAPGNDGIEYRLAFALQRRSQEQRHNGVVEQARESARRGIELLLGQSDANAVQLREQLAKLLDEQR